MKKCICLLWLLMAVCFCSPAGAETGLYFLSWDMDGDAVCYALEVTTEDGEVLYADDSVWQNEVIFPADIPSEAEEKIFRGGGRFRVLFLLPAFDYCIIIVL